jgi:L-aminopeptidase/D-esterase-like protein
VNAGSITDVAGINVGHWTDIDALTGCTVILPDTPCVAGVDVRGAAPGTRETDALKPGNLVQHVHAVLLSGGSAYGLDAATGVVRWLRERKRGYQFSKGVVPIVPSAVLFDLAVGAHDRWPDAEAGYQAASAAAGRCEEGNVGAGTGATVGKALGLERSMKGGLGTASEASVHGLLAGAVAAVNASGDVLGEDGRIIAGAIDDKGAIADTVDLLRQARIWQPEVPQESTVLVCVATNAMLTKEQANRLATVCHDGLARAVRPAHTQGDGDIVFTLATGARALEGPDYRILEALATRAVERAIRRGVETAESVAGIPSARDVGARRAATG